MKNLFLSAGIPDVGTKYARTADPLLILSAVRSLCSLTFGHKHIVWGGHPAITPMVWAACENMGHSFAATVTLYQSRFFEDKYPEDNARFQNTVFVDALIDDKASLLRMREQMLKSRKYEAAIFIGGMRGVRDEYRMAREFAAGAKLLVLPSTGGAAQELATAPDAIFPAEKDFIDFTTFFSEHISIERPKKPRPSRVRRR